MSKEKYHVVSLSGGKDSILGNLGQIAHGMSELRNLYGDGHGKPASFVSLPPRYARLAVGTVTAAARFIWETHIETQSK